MAHLIPTPPSQNPPNAFEQLVVQTLLRELPADYGVMPPFSFKQHKDRPPFEVDVTVFAPHAIYLVECKEWYGRITGDDTEWLINDRTPKARVMDLVDLKAKALKTVVGAAPFHRFEAACVVPDGTQVLLDRSSGWSGNLHTLASLVRWLQDPVPVRHFGAPITPFHKAYVKALQGKWGDRKRAGLKRVGGFDLTALVGGNDACAVYKAQRSLVADPTPYRVRVWDLPGTLTAGDRAKRMARLRRPTEAVARIGQHANLLRVIHFDVLPDENGFFEVTEWSEFGLLHGYLRNKERPPLTTRERLEIVAGVANALVAVHAQGVVHRNLCPETILVGFDRQPRITDFDRAYIDATSTVFPHVRTANKAYLAPELKDAADYDFDAHADTYSLGVLLYELLVGQPPFADAEAALAENGSPPVTPSAVCPGVDDRVDQLVMRLLSTDDFHARPSASDALQVLQEVLGESTAQTGGGNGAAAPEPLSFEPGNIVGEYMVEGKLGEGSFSTVFRVQHIQQGKRYAMKVLRSVEHADTLMHEFGTGERLPRHDNIAAIQWLGRLPDNTGYILSELVEGEPLTPYCEGVRTMPLPETRRIGLALLDALDALHPRVDRIHELERRTCTDSEQEELERLRRTGILHRDIKPANILLDRRNRPKLIDFNIAALATEATGRAGTPRYWAPDRGQPQWEPSDDLFSLGVVLYEMFALRHPYASNAPGNGTPFDPTHIAPDRSMSRPLADFLLQAVQPTKSERFRTAAEMRAALAAIETLHAVAPTPAVVSSPSATPDRNPYVDQILTLYSQATRSNAGTRGLDDIGRLTYVQTRLDEKLAPAILDGSFRLVIVTGNAGDGKTAFLQQLEVEFTRRGVVVTAAPSRNGATWTYDGVNYASNYDGSQDEGDTVNDDVLAEFLAPFKGNSIAGLGGSAGRLIAINEGRLLDFLQHSPHRDDFVGLRRAVRGVLTEGGEPPDRMLVVNLNMRAIAAGGQDSLVEKQLSALLQDTIWAPCGTCSLATRCPLKANADTLRDPASGAAVRERVRRLFEIVHLRRQQHVTMRDLRSALSWLLLQDKGCADVAAFVAAGKGDAMAALSYTESLGQDGAASADRLVRLLRDLDVGLVEDPALDRRLNAEVTTAVPWLVFERRAPYHSEVFRTLDALGPNDTGDVAALLDARRRLLRVRRRKVYFERRDLAWRAMTPYRALDLMEPVVLGTATTEQLETLKARIVEGISLLEGIRHEGVRTQFVALRASRVKNASARSFRLFGKDRFELRVDIRGGISRYMEVTPDSIAFSAKNGMGTASLRLSLDLLEMLEMVRLGFRPSAGDMGGLFVNLAIFRNALLHMPYNEVLVTTDDTRFYRIQALSTAAGGVSLHIAPETPSGGGAK
jgi:serine/threonine protein kinase